MNTPIKTKEEILDSVMECTCDIAYKSRQMAAPDCAYCQNYEAILAAMQSYADQVTGVGVREEARLYAESQMWPDWDRKDGVSIASFYGHFIDYILDRPLPSTKGEDELATAVTELLETIPITDHNYYLVGFSEKLEKVKKLLNQNATSGK